MDGNENLLTVLRSLLSNKQAITAVLPLLGRYGAAGVVTIARGYLGPLAHHAAVVDKRESPSPTEPTDTNATTVKAGLLAAGDVAVLQLALNKLVYELGEVALHNPKLDPNGKQPEFKLDDNGCPPAMSVTHVLAAARLWRDYSARRDVERQVVQVEAAVAARSVRSRLQLARSERYAAAPRYSYVAPVATYRSSRG